MRFKFQGLIYQMRLPGLKTLIASMRTSSDAHKVLTVPAHSRVRESEQFCLLDLLLKYVSFSSAIKESQRTNISHVLKRMDANILVSNLSLLFISPWHYY